MGEIKVRKTEKIKSYLIPDRDHFVCKVKCLFIIVSPLLKGPAISDL